MYIYICIYIFTHIYAYAYTSGGLTLTLTQGSALWHDLYCRDDSVEPHAVLFPEQVRR